MDVAVGLMWREGDGFGGRVDVEKTFDITV